ncbi:6-hydroxymethylpterin diphosphokinase MptE-like protein [Aminivibrio sp.]|uniref:motility associated factor glycosyltransferase family protein n=1 Tax=Aminivibrio sp. TaxID=1872489 RepID=UPI001A62D1A1|nr:6-hydroxymethylpterin diphosphokinase MptE-like protein [Aminivibrio sp.]MBL3539459.1 motility associated factor glycosyltransferase family protein [Aminivibrio sp.]
MNDIPALLEQNLRTLEKSQPKLAARLRQYMDELPALKEPVFRETPSGRWVEGLTEKPFFEKKSLLEKRSKTAPSAVYLVFGVGCAPYLFHVLRSLPREALSVVVIEPSLDLLLLTLSQTSVFQALPQGARISFIIDKDRIFIDEAFAWNVVPIGIFPVSKAEAIAHDGQNEWESMTELKNTLRKEIIYRLTMLGNSPEDTLLGFRHAALNTPRILRSPRIADLRENYGGKPFVCVAAGPSLEKNVHLLKDIQDKCVIVACDTVLFHLLEKGIIPHVVTSIERPYDTYAAWVPRVLEKHRETCEQILLLSQSVSYPLTAGRWPGPNIVVGKMDVPVDSWFTGAVLGEQVLYSGLSVAHMALSLALACEAPSVALIGQDLAFGEGGVSHASETVPDTALAVEQEHRRNGITVPGALGGMVETSTIWLTFIQIFERMIVNFPGTPVYDCTEGGALIEGTIVTPFADFIEKRIIDPEFAVSRWGGPETEKEIRSDLSDRFSGAFSQLDQLERKLQEMHKEIQRCTAPALLPEKRQAFAFSTAGILDQIHAMNPVISFIGQSYTHLSGTVLAENRFLETVEQVERWKRLHEEIADSHSFAVRFLRQWLAYARDLAKAMTDGNFTDPGAIDGNGEEEFLGLYAGAAEGNALSVELLDLLSCKDPLRENWSPDGLWKAALVLFLQGRADEAGRFMKKAYDSLEGTELPTETIGAFFKDWGKMAAADDLCVFPQTEEAAALFANAKEYLPDDPEIPALQKAVMGRRKNLVLEFQKMRHNQKDELSILLQRNAAENALLEGDLYKALTVVDKLVWDNLDLFPASGVLYLQWLMKTAANCTEAADKKIADCSVEILDRIISKLPLLLERKINFPVEFLSYMTRKGIKFSMDPSDIQTGDQ